MEKYNAVITDVLSASRALGCYVCELTEDVEVEIKNVVVELCGWPGKKSIIAGSWCIDENCQTWVELYGEGFTIKKKTDSVKTAKSIFKKFNLKWDY